ncbi:hypothetical protein [Macrococcoides caseolyticum]|uniref:hypothetical protein n=1 Tax=Macrococcoides caseolyticum TaxID=69966 RepID=UPI000C3444D6|nr:hypothetical protein [Macrococcus caseolyticus]PKE63792.1 hypothetical protein CW683_02345 [Macrococcus caseolyticus]
MEQFKFTRTLLGFFNIYIPGSDELIATLPSSTMKQFIKGFDGTASFGCFEADISNLKGVIK